MSENNKDIRIPATKKPTPGDLEAAKPAAEQKRNEELPPQRARLQLKPFPDGMPLRYSPNPRKAGTWVLHDSTGTPLAVSLSPEVADFLCNCAAIVWIEQQKVRAAQLAEIEKLSDAVDADAAIATDAEHPVGQNGEVAPFTPIASPALSVVNPPADVTDPPVANPQ